MTRTTYLTLAIPVPDDVPEAMIAPGVADIRARLEHFFSQGELIVTVVPERHIELEDIRDFHNKMSVPMSPVPAFLDGAAHEFRTKFMREELTEFDEAYTAGDLDKAHDALQDLVYVAIGTALKMGLPWAARWPRVQKANMSKRLALPDGSDSKRGSPLDVIKPEDFVAPEGWDLPGMRPGAVAPVFHATNAMTAMGRCRAQDRPAPVMIDYVHGLRSDEHDVDPETSSYLPADQAREA